MVYFISNQTSLQAYEDIQLTSLEYLFEYFKLKKIIGVDTETEGFDVYQDKVLLIQFGDRDHQFVVDTTTINLKVFKEFLEDKSKIFLYHNAKFDLKFLYHAGIFPFENIYDSFLGERVISCGISSHRKSLQACVYRYFKHEMSKEERGLIHKLGIYNSRIINYAANDVVYLEGIRKFQLDKAKELQVEKTISLENLFVSVLTYVEYCGVSLDVEGWILKASKDSKLMLELEEILNSEVEKLNNPKYLSAPDLFSTVPRCTIQWSSSKQVIPLFLELGLNLTVIDKKTKKEKLSIEDKVIASQVSIHPIIQAFSNYQKVAKLVSTYGNNFLKHINPVTGRIHTNFTQIINSGRLSSGKEDPKDAKPGEVNMQNIPSGKERHYFIPAKENNFIVADYTGQETQVLCYYANDESYRDYVTNPTKDLHSFMARLVDIADKGKLSELRDLSDMEIKSNHSDKRTAVKPGTFCIPYGGSGFTIAVNIGISPEAGEWVYEEYMKYFSGLKQYFEKVKAISLDQGYVLINPMTGRKWFYANNETYHANKLRLESYSDGSKGKPFQGLSSGFWSAYKQEKSLESSKFLEMKEILRIYFKIRGNMERVGLNAPIQGTAADISKLAGIKLFRWIHDNNYLGKVKIVVPLHDEYVIEAPEELSEQSAKALQESMESAAKIFCPTVDIKAKPIISKSWQH
jgi:DNA polymerase I-like protein with 3'-5' exonuclease and polymerase domains